MGTIADLKRGLAKVNLSAKIPAIIESQASIIIALNQGPKQLLGGLDVDGYEIDPGYKLLYYERYKNKLNPLPGLGIPDLRLTGSFYRNFIVSAGYTGIFTVESLDAKAQLLENKYGKTIYGLNKQNKTLYATTNFYEALKEYFTGKTGLVFR